MFTGIITDIGTITAIEQRGDLRASIATGYDMASVDLGASIACSGVCLTVVDKGPGWFAVDISGETVTPEGASLRLTIAADRALAPFLAPKGSVALDGVSLTVNDVADEAGRVTIGVNIIPHTAAATTLADAAAGRALNIEIDVLARYLGRMEAARAA